MGDVPRAVEFAKKEAENETACIGTDVQHLDKNMTGAVSWLKHLENLPKSEAVKANMVQKRLAKEEKKAGKKAAKKANKR